MLKGAIQSQKSKSLVVLCKLRKLAIEARKLAKDKVDEAINSF